VGKGMKNENGGIEKELRIFLKEEKKKLHLLWRRYNVRS